MNPELQNLINLWNKLSAADKYTFQKNVQIFDGHNIILGTGTGTKIGTSTGQKIGLYGVTPVVQANSIGAPSIPGGTYSSSVAQSSVDAINSIRTALKNLGITA